jgi:hypothetical protein
MSSTIVIFFTMYLSSDFDGLQSHMDDNLRCEHQSCATLISTKLARDQCWKSFTSCQQHTTATGVDDWHQMGMYSPQKPRLTASGLSNSSRGDQQQSCCATDAETWLALFRALGSGTRGQGRWSVMRDIVAIHTLLLLSFL